MRETGRSAWWRATLLIVLCGTALFLFFRVPILSGFTTLFGEEYDATIEVVLLEHWYAVVRGLEEWTSPNYFFPYRGGLGYNDGFVLSGLIYSVFRTLGADPYLANTFVYATLKTIGFFAMYQLLRGALHCRFWTAALGATLFVVSNNTLMQALHGQLMMLNLTPLLAFQLIRFGRAVLAEQARSALRWGAAFGVSYGAVALNGFYMAWFFGYFTLATVALLALLMGTPARQMVWRGIHAMPATLAAVALIALAALVPLISVYLPQFTRGNAHSYLEAMDEMARPSGIINVGVGNLVWGRLVAGYYALRHADGVPGGEQVSGFPLLLLALGLAAITAHAVRRRDPLAAAAALALVATWVSTLRFGDHSAWRLPYVLVPGASALRALARYQIFLTMPLIALAMTWLNALRGDWVRWAAPVLAVLLVLEQVNCKPPVGVDRAAQLGRIASIPPLPKACRAFFIVYAAPPNRHEPWEWAYVDADEDRGTSAQIDAMLLAALRRVPTINGYATFGPPDGLSGDTTAPEFLSDVRSYIATHRLSGVCGYDRRRSPHWFTHPFGQLSAE